LALAGAFVLGLGAAFAVSISFAGSATLGAAGGGVVVTGGAEMSLGDISSDGRVASFLTLPNASSHHISAVNMMMALMVIGKYSIMFFPSSFVRQPLQASVAASCLRLPELPKRVPSRLSALRKRTLC
jgi:hypothetical protein